MFVEPFSEHFKLPTERALSKRHQDAPRTFVLQRQDESLNQGDTAMLTNSTEAGRDVLAVTPVLEDIAPKLRALCDTKSLAEVVLT